jgi:putative endonuclease
MIYFVYILENKDENKYYIGQTNNLTRRIKDHNKGYNVFTSKNKNWQLVYKKEFNSRSDAIKFERFIKRQKSRLFIKKLINNEFVPR